VSTNGQRTRIVVGGDVPSAIDPPSGCVFHPRCPRFHEGHCDVTEPVLEHVPGDSGHVAACYYPLERWPMDEAAMTAGTAATVAPES
jgi:oligopeptide/dipeptide ABC transporter ATP-binding protein